jgi:dihydroxy-acid dehydratase
LIGLLKDGDPITIDAEKNVIEAHLSEEEIAKRRANWVTPPIKATSGILYKYAKTVSSASEGCVTDEF